MGFAAALLRRRPAMGSAAKSACCSDSVLPLREPVPVAKPARARASASSAARTVLCSDSIPPM
eukprot:10246934-Alexandrium_andersonii.AAC.1